MEAESVLSFTIGRLRDLLVQEGVYLQALKGPVDELIEMLTKMEELLEYARVRRDKRTAEIIELADHLIDSIETYVFRSLSGYIGIRERFLRPKVLMAIDKVTTKVNELVNSQSGVQSDDGEAPRREYKVQDLSGFNEDDFVGREENINKLVSFLVDEESEQFRVISLYGMGGLGKTTLARKVYKDKKVLSHFQGFAFVCVSEQCQAEEILKHILQQLLPEKKEEMTDGDVIKSLQRVQGEKKCVVVIDDVWSVCDWERLNRGIPDGCRGGSKVLLMTRIKDVADKGFCYSLRCLSNDECWNLFQKKIFMTCRDPQVVRRMEELGNKMIARCRGIPLAVMVLRGVLVTKYTSREWERFYESRTWGANEFKGEVVRELLFSYKELPYPLRPCFLYLANFDEDQEIEPEKLYRLWDAEGMILSKDRKVGETMMDVAERYLGELVGRSMVEAELQEEVDPSVTKRYKLCRVHDLLRELCLSIVQKENFLKVHDHFSTEDKVVVLKPSCQRNDIKIPARLRFCFGWGKEFSVHGKIEATCHVRSLMFERGSGRKLLNLKKLNLLRVLSLDHTSIGKEDFTNELIHLRYFVLRGCNIGMLPASMDKLIYLQTLDLRVLHSHLSIPKFAMKNFKRLRHLFLPYTRTYKVTPEFSKLRLDGLKDLETLANLDSTTCEMEDAIQLTNLTRLEWSVQISSEGDGEELKRFLNKVNLDPSRHSLLEIVLVNPEIEMYSNVIRGQLPEYCVEILDKLAIWGLRRKLSPEFINLYQLTVLTLYDFEFKEDPMPNLEKLSNLRVLKLKLGRCCYQRSLAIMRDKTKEKEMACSTMGFPRLHSISISNLKNWEKWRVEEGAMPMLEWIWIEECEKLEMLPDGLRFITSLNFLSIGCMPEEFKRRLIGEAGEEGPDFDKIRHVRKVIVGLVLLEVLKREKERELKM